MRRAPVYNNSHSLFCLLLFLCGSGMILLNRHAPINDFGNYYYGSLLWTKGIGPLNFYQDIHLFNEYVKAEGADNFFLNYAPVPPFSLLFYLPFTWAGPFIARLIFNLFCLAVFCFSLARFMKRNKVPAFMAALIPFVFFLPLYSSFKQGQSYLLMTALALEYFMAHVSRRPLVSGLSAALMFSLKIFPAFVLIISVFRKDWKGLAWTLVFTSGFFLSVTLTAGWELPAYYFRVIFPRLLMNDVSAPFNPYDQGIASFLLKAFVPDRQFNPSPFADAPWLAAICMLLFQAFVLSFVWQVLRKKELNSGIVMVLIGLVLINRYMPVYSLVLLIPVFLLAPVVLKQKESVLLTLCLFLAVNIPVHWLQQFALALRYPRLVLMFCLFVFLLIRWRERFSPGIFMIMLLFGLPAAIAMADFRQPIVSFRTSMGLVYDFSLSGDTLTMLICRGSIDTTEKVFVGNIKAGDPLKNEGYRARVKKKIPYREGWLKLTDARNGVGMFYVSYEKKRKYH